MAKLSERSKLSRTCISNAANLLASAEINLQGKGNSASSYSLARLVKNLGEFIGGRTLIVATHRAPVLKLVNRIIWLDSGRLVADGPKAEVLTRISGAAA